MEATASFSTFSSRHFSPSLPLPQTTLSNIKFPKKSAQACPSSWTGSTPSLSFSSRTSRTREIWGVINSRIDVTQRREMWRGFVVRAEMFGQLTSGLEAAWNKLKGEEVLTKENIAKPMRDIRRALLEADVSGLYPMAEPEFE